MAQASDKTSLPRDGSGAGGSAGFARFAPLGFCLLGIIWVYWPQWTSGFQNMPALLRDPRLVNYTLEHTFRWVMQYPLHAAFWQTPLFYPQPNVTAFTDVLIGAGPFYWVWRWLGAQPDSAFQYWMVTCSALNFAAGYLLLFRGLRVRIPAATLGAFLIAFGGPATIRAWHPQLIPQFWVCLAILALCEIFAGDATARRSSRVRIWVVVLCGVSALQFYTAFYPLFFFGLFAGLALCVSLLRATTRQPIVEFARWHGVFAAGWIVAAAIVMAPLLWQYWSTAEALGYRPFMTRFAPRPASWFLMGTDNYWWDWLQREGGPFSLLADIEHAGGVGFLSAAVAAAGLWGARHLRTARVLAVASGLLMLTATLFGDFSVWHWIHRYVPGAGAIRVISRITMVLAVVVPLGIALFVDRGVGLSAERGRRVLTLALALSCILEQVRSPLPQVDKREMRQHIAVLAERVGPDCTAFATVYSGPPGYLLEDDDAAWIQLATGKPTVNGRYGNNPKGWKLYRHQSDGARPNPAELKRAATQWLASFGNDSDTLCWVEYR